MNRPENDKSFVMGLLDAKFLIAAAILAVSAVGMQGTVRALGKRYMKEPVGLRRSIRDFDVSQLTTFKNWKHFSHPIIDDVGTDEALLLSFDLVNVSSESNHAEFFVTYYSDPRDKVPHTPEVCSRQAGAIVRKISKVTIEVPELDEKIKAKFLQIENKDSSIIDIYFFCVEGKFTSSREIVRLYIAKPGNKHTFFSKIEAAVTFQTKDDIESATKICKQMLREGVAELVKNHYPTMEQTKGK